MENKRDKEIRRVITFAGILLVAMVALIICLIAVFLDTDPGTTKSPLSDLQSEHLVSDPDPVRKEDLDAAYEAKTPMTMATQETIKVSMLSYLSRGDFSGLDTYIVEQQAAYKVPTGDDMQEMEDWRTNFELIRGDIAKTQNLTPENAAQTFTSYYYPEILAAALCYSPISVKRNAYVDWSAAILPAETQPINLSPVEFESPVEELREINSTANEQYMDICAYDVTLFGYRFRITLVQNIYGFFVPYSMRNTDGFMRNATTRADIDEIEGYLSMFVDLDGSIVVPRIDQSWVEEEKVTHPERFDENGVYIFDPEPSPTVQPQGEEEPSTEPAA